ncbi:MAG TPA: ABC transporter permease, partial [Vicinamibacteria bacterium]|nr:ABC transporter permease [Vicinamibacteria bacterium]
MTMEAFARDARYGLRRLARNPGFSAIAIVTLTLGIGAGSTIFSVVNAVLLRPLPFRNPQELIAVSQRSTDTQAGAVPMSFTKYEAIRDQARSLERIAVYYPLSLSLGGESEPERVAAARVSRDLFDVLGVTPAQGAASRPRSSRREAMTSRSSRMRCGNAASAPTPGSGDARSG